jgi:hypothetical protein
MNRSNSSKERTAMKLLINIAVVCLLLSIVGCRDKANAKAHSNRGVAWRELGQDDKAAADFKEAKRLDPSLEE